MQSFAAPSGLLGIGIGGGREAAVPRSASTAPSALLASGHRLVQHGPCCRRALRVSAAAAAAGPLPLSYRAVTTDPQLAARRADHVEPPAPPRLLSRSLTLNPLHGACQWLEGRLMGVDLAMAAALDRHPALHAAAAVVTAGATVLGLHPCAMWLRGLPPPVADSLDPSTWVGEMAAPLMWATLVAFGALVAAWQLRTWWTAQLALMRPSHELGISGSAAEVAAPGAANASGVQAGKSTGAGAFASLVPAQLQGLIEPDWKPTDKSWLYVIMVTRLGTLLAATSCLMSGANWAAAGYTAICFAASLLPLGIPHLRALLAQPPSATDAAAAFAAAADAMQQAVHQHTSTTKAAGQGQQLEPLPSPSASAIGLPLLAADAAFLLAVAPCAPVAARLAAGAALAAGLTASAVASSASGRLDPHRAAAGDEVSFHVTLRLPSGTPLDTTLGHIPLCATVTPPAASDASASASDSDDMWLSSPSTSASAAGSGADAMSGYSGRFELLRQVLACSVLEGMYVGERRTVNLLNELIGEAGEGSSGPPVVRNPNLVWWQPLSDVVRRLRSIPGPGDVFMYPLGGLVADVGSPKLSAAAAGANDAAALPSGLGGWGPVRVGAVTSAFVELDGNVGSEGEALDVEVQVVGLAKARHGSEAHTFPGGGAQGVLIVVDRTPLGQPAEYRVPPSWLLHGQPT